jgi:hypothetical protein
MNDEPASRQATKAQFAPVASIGAARTVFALAAAASLGGVLVQLVVSWSNTEGLFESPAGRAFNVLCYFTVQSNLIVGVTCLLLALAPKPRGVVFDVARLTGIVAITVTAVVFHTALRGLQELSGCAALADFLLHTASPLFALVGWVLFGPRGRIDRRIKVLTIVFPLAWAAFTFVRGPIVDFYPYPFLDVDEIGYARSIANVLLVGLLFLALAWIAGAADKRLGRNVPPDH